MDIMRKYLHVALGKIQSNRLLAVFAVTLAGAVLMGTTVVRAAGPDYLSFTKPGNASICYGGHWKTVYRWHWWHRYRAQIWMPNWEENGFESKGQCLNYMSTPAPTSKSQCRYEWWRLGF